MRGFTVSRIQEPTKMKDKNVRTETFVLIQSLIRKSYQLPEKVERLKTSRKDLVANSVLNLS